MELTPKSQEEILSALYTIQQVCIQADSCEACPLHCYTDDCAICRSTPDRWKIKSKQTSWTAFE